MKYVSIVLTTIFLFTCSSTPKVPRGVLKEAFTQGKSIYEVNVYSENKLQGVSAAFKQTSQQINDITTSQQLQMGGNPLAYGIASGVATAIIGTAMYIEQQEFLDPINEDLKNRDFDSKYSQRIIDTLAEESWLEIGDTHFHKNYSKPKISAPILKPQINITLSYTLDPATLQSGVMAEVEVYHPDGEIETKLKKVGFDKKWEKMPVPIFEQSFKYLSGTYRMPMRPQEEIDSQVAKVKNEFATLTDEQKKDYKERTNYFKKLKAAKKRGYTNEYLKNYKMNLIKEDDYAYLESALEKAIDKIKGELHVALSHRASMYGDVDI